MACASKFCCDPVFSIPLNDFENSLLILRLNDEPRPLSFFISSRFTANGSLFFSSFLKENQSAVFDISIRF
jgi:hypothetical protein